MNLKAVIKLGNTFHLLFQCVFKLFYLQVDGDLKFDISVISFTP